MLMLGIIRYVDQMRVTMKKLNASEGESGEDPYLRLCHGDTMMWKQQK